MPVTKVKVNGSWVPAMPVGGGGEGDMTKAVYDINDDGVVNAADQATKDGSGNVITSTYAAKATTLSGYGITDAKIQNGSIILGSNSITPLTSFTETDPTVPSWAKAASKPTYTATEVGAISTSAKGAASGVAELDANGLVPSSQLPSYVDDVLEYNAKSSFPTTGETGKIYVDTSTNLTYRWGGSDYVEISPSLALGTTSSTAFRGDYGQSAYTHAVTNKGSAFSSGLYKITTNSEGHVTAAVTVTASDIPGLSSKADSATTLAGYGITDAKIESGTITLGSNSITPLTSYTETDPTVPSWAKQSTKPTYTAQEVGALPSSTSIPSKTSDLTNDSGFITASSLSGYIASDEIGKVYVSDTEPSNTSNYDIWIDTSTTLQNANGVMV